MLLDKGLLLIHPRCTKLKAAFQNYRRKRTGRGDWLDEPEDPQHPHEDLIDALRGGVRDRFPDGRIESDTGIRLHQGRLDRLTGREGRATTKEVLFSGPVAAFTCKQASTDPLAAADQSRPPAACDGRHAIMDG